MNKYLKPEFEVIELTMVDVIETSGEGGNKPGLNNGGSDQNPGDITFPDFWE